MGSKRKRSQPPVASQQGKHDGESPPEDANSELPFDVAIVVRAITRLVAAQSKGTMDDADEALLEAARPIIGSKATQYQESAKAAKQTARELGKPVKHEATSTKVPVMDASKGDEPTLTGAELSTSIGAFKTLANKPNLIEVKACKALRTAMHPLVASHVQESKASPAFRVTCMLGQRPRWPEAQALLHELRSLEPSRRPKLGAYQRWVRELDVAEGDPQQLLMLDAVMRLASGLPKSSSALSSQLQEGRCHRYPPFRAQRVQRRHTERAAPEMNKEQSAAEEKVELPVKTAEVPAQPQSAADKLISLIAAGRQKDGSAGDTARSGVHVIAHEAARDRKPPNHFDLNIYGCQDSTLGISLTAEPTVTGTPVSGVSGAFVLSNVLSPEECLRVVKMSEEIGYTPDTPLSSNLDERAHNVVLMATEAQNDALFKRVQPLLPEELAGESLLTINRRWRLYRYREGNLYRKHLDGAWPASGLQTTSKGQTEYIYDAYNGTARSRLTFIIYLNDDFEGGETTFFVPRPDTEGLLESRPIKPCCGSASVFPHGDTGIPLLHEGSSVKKGTKYLLRTDVVYMCKEDPAALKEAVRLRGLARKIGVANGVKEAGDEPDKKGTSKQKGKAKKQPARTHKGKKVINHNTKNGQAKVKDGKAPHQGSATKGGKKLGRQGSKKKGD